MGLMSRLEQLKIKYPDTNNGIFNLFTIYLDIS